MHSKESFDAKQKGHELYEKIRAVSTLKRDKEAMKEEIKRIHGIVKNPPNIEAIHDYKMPQKEKERIQIQKQFVFPYIMEIKNPQYLKDTKTATLTIV